MNNPTERSSLCPASCLANLLSQPPSLPYVNPYACPVNPLKNLHPAASLPHLHPTLYPIHYAEHIYQTEQPDEQQTEQQTEQPDEHSDDSGLGYMGAAMDIDRTINNPIKQPLSPNGLCDPSYSNTRDIIADTEYLPTNSLTSLTKTPSGDRRGGTGQAEVVYCISLNLRALIQKFLFFISNQKALMKALIKALIQKFLFFILGGPK